MPVVAKLFPHLYYGWILTATLGVTETVSWGILYYAFSVFVQPMEAEMGWSRTDVSGAFSLALLASGLAAVPVGRWLDRHGPRVLMTVGSIAATLLVLAWAHVRDLQTLYVIWIGIGLTMAAVLYEPAFAVVATWFRRHRGRALTLLTLMAGLASTIFLPLAAWLTELQGWRGALVTLAAILGVTTIVPHALFLHHRPEDVGQMVDGISIEQVAPGNKAASLSGNQGDQGNAALSMVTVLAQPRFRWLALAFCINALCSMAIAVHLVPYFSSRGLDPQFAATAVGLIGAMQLVGRLIFAPLDGRVPPFMLAAVMLLVQPVALAFLLAVPGTASWPIFVFLFGIGRGAMTLVRASLVATLYGPARYGTISGVLALLATIAHTIAPVAAGAGFDFFGAYDVPFWTVAALWLTAAGALLVAGQFAKTPESSFA
ncbi:MAG TPA: MFS transporter [Chloroflexota bacterium]|nr:MFS transporter [Chloroflexota bacterium]